MNGGIAVGHFPIEGLDELIRIVRKGFYKQKLNIYLC